MGNRRHEVGARPRPSARLRNQRGPGIGMGPHRGHTCSMTFPPGSTRVLVTGNAGSGKTSFASSLAKVLDVPCHSLDGIVWQERWRKTPQPEKDSQIETLIATDAWVIDGVSDRALQAADVVVFLDVPRLVSAWRAMRRNVRYLFKSRPGLPPRCPEILVIPKLARLIWRFPNHVRPTILVEKQRRRGGTFVHVTWPQRADRLLDDLHASLPIDLP